MKRQAIYLALFLSLFGGVAHAHQEGPERIVENKYVVSLTVVPEDDYSMGLIFFFNDAQTGSTVSDINPKISIADPGGNLILDRQPIEVASGRAELKYVFPAGGLHEIFVEFEKFGEPGKVYRPDEGWSLRVPGETGTGIGSNYSIGLEELVSLGLAGTAAILVAWSFMHNRKKR